MATDETQNEEPEVAEPTVEDNEGAGTPFDPSDPSSTSGDSGDSSTTETPPTTGTPPEETPSVDESGTDPTATPASGDSGDVPPEQQTPAPGSGDVSVPSAAGPAGPPTNVGNAGGTAAVTADESDAASPTGGANIAGTPDSQLNLAPPMTDESGSNIPAPNLVQPPVEGALGDSPQANPDAFDPALVDPVGTAAEAKKGTTSDPNTRTSDTHIDEVPPDYATDGPKPSDGGAERYPFPQGGDVEVALIENQGSEQEFWPALTVEDTVILGDHDLIPERLRGRRAFITDAPRYLVPVGEEERVWISVRTRDEVNASLRVPLSAVELQRGGRDATVRG
jgi:hypothetical protein